MSEEITFSIITVCYNEENRIGETLRSVFLQSYSNYEYIIQDGGSCDKTLEIVERERNFYGNNQLKMFVEEDSGLYDAMNKAVMKAKGKYICFLNCGDYLYDSNTLEKIAGEIESTPGMDWYYGDSIIIYPNQDERSQVICTYENITGKIDLEMFRNRDINLIHQSIFSAKSCFEDNLFDTSYRLRAELKWYYDCFLSGCKVKKMSIPVCKYAYGGLSERAESVRLSNNETLRIFSENGLLTENRRKDLISDTWKLQVKKNIFDQWLALKQAGFNLDKYFENRGYKKIVIYGYGDLGNHLINELRRSEVEIKAIIDRDTRYEYQRIPVINLEELSNDIDVVIVCAVTYYSQVREMILKKVSVDVISIEDVLEGTWE